jgi:hypothetical protein
VSVHPAPAMRAPFAPARAVSGIAAENQISSASRTTTISPTLTRARPPSPRSLRDPEQRHPQAQEARRRSHGPLRQEEDQGSPDPLRRQRPHPRRKCSSRFFLGSGLRSRRGGGCPGNARRRRRARSDASIRRSARGPSRWLNASTSRGNASASRRRPGRTHPATPTSGEDHPPAGHRSQDTPHPAAPNLRNLPPMHRGTGPSPRRPCRPPLPPRAVS